MKFTKTQLKNAYKNGDVYTQLVDDVIQEVAPREDAYHIIDILDILGFEATLDCLVVVPHIGAKLQRAAKYIEANGLSGTPEELLRRVCVSEVY